MHISIKKKYLVIIVLINLVTIILIGILLTQRTDQSCENAKKYYFVKKCGYITSDKNNDSTLVAGIITKKAQKDRLYTLELTTQNTNGSLVKETLSFPPSPQNVGYTVNTKVSKNQPTSNLVTQEVLFNKIHLGDEVVVVIPTPKQHEIQMATQKLGKSTFIDCYHFNKLFIENMKNQSTKTLSALSAGKKSTNCTLSVAELIIYQ